MLTGPTGAERADAWEDIRLDRPAPHVLTMTIHRPQARNALRSRTLREIAAALAEAAADDAVRAVVLTGGDAVFAAGADIGELAAHDAVSILTDSRPALWQTIRQFPKPLIGAVNGFCLGGGNELAMHCDVLICGETARFGQPEINLGIIPGAGGTQRLAHALSKSEAMRLVLSGEMLDARAALMRGLVSEVCPPELTVERAVALAVRIAEKPPLAARLAKEAVLKAFEVGLEQGLAHERRAFCQLFATQDRQEGLAAFKEKRRPSFTGR